MLESIPLPALPEPETVLPEPVIEPASPGPEVDVQVGGVPEVGVEGAEGAELTEPPVLDVDQGRSSPWRYVHGAPLHNVVEEEEEE